MKHQAEHGGKSGRGEMIAVCSAKGGIGRTVMTVNLAVALSKNNLHVGVFDADFQFGDVCLAMDLHPTFTIKDVVDSMEIVDQHALQGYLMHHPCGVHVLAAPERPEHADLVTSEAIDKLSGYMTSQYDYVIADTGVGLQAHTLQLIEKADQIFMLTTLEMSSVKKTKTMLDTLELLGLRRKVQVVINRSTMDSVIKATDVADLLEAETPVYIPNDFALVSGSLNTGIPFVLNQGKTEIAKAYFKTAEQMISRREIALFQPKKPSLLQSIFGKTKSNATS